MINLMNHQIQHFSHPYVDQSFPTMLCWNFPLYVPQNSMSTLNNFPQISSPHEKIMVDLNIEELKEAGYDNCKRIWS